jgi:arabinofuranosyltransferase
MPRRRTWITAGVLLFACLGLGAHALRYPFITDDAYISFRYAYNFATTGALVFNPGERVEGYTNFLWTLLLGLLLKARLRPEVMARLLGFAFGAATLLLVYLLGRRYRGGRPTGWELLAPVTLPASGVFAVWCSGGLETQMFTALCLGGVTAYVGERAAQRRGRGLWLSGFLLALASMTRPEGLLFFGLVALHRLLANLLGERRLRPTAGELGLLLGFAIPFGAFFAWRTLYYGYPLPNTFYVKAQGGSSASALRWGVPYLKDFVEDAWLYPVLPLALLLPLLRPRTTAAPPTPAPGGAPGGVRPRFFLSLLSLLVVPYVAYVVAVGGDFMAMGRFFVPVLPYLFLVSQEALRELVERGPRLEPDAWRPARMLPVAALLLSLLVVNAVRLHRESQKLSYRRWGLDTIAYLQKFADDRIRIGTWMRRNLPRETYLAVGGAGAIVYASRLRALDTFGLNDLYIAHQAPAAGDRPGHTKFAPEPYLLERKPDLMCHEAKHQDWPFRPSPEDGTAWRAKGYEWVCIVPEGLRPTHYCCLKRIGKELGPFAAVADSP